MAESNEPNQWTIEPRAWATVSGFWIHDSESRPIVCVISPLGDEDGEEKRAKEIVADHLLRIRLTKAVAEYLRGAAIGKSGIYSGERIARDLERLLRGESIE
jgi:hypothetical protein